MKNAHRPPAVVGVTLGVVGVYFGLVGPVLLHERTLAFGGTLALGIYQYNEFQDAVGQIDRSLEELERFNP